MENMQFEEAIKKLEEIVSKLESGKCSLEESMQLFEEGTKLSVFCKKSLEDAELRIKELQAQKE